LAARDRSRPAPFYRSRRPRDTPLFQLLERHFAEFERVYPERFAASYGHWRPIVAGTVAKFLRCGDLHEGFARVKCRACKHEFFVAFSCKQPCVCPSCHQKRSLRRNNRNAAGFALSVKSDRAVEDARSRKEEFVLASGCWLATLPPKLPVNTTTATMQPVQRAERGFCLAGTPRPAHRRTAYARREVSMPKTSAALSSGRNQSSYPLIAVCGMILVLCSLATADDLQTLDGKLYQGVRVTRVEPDGITVTYASGMAKLKFRDLPTAVREQHGYNATAAAKYEGEQQQRLVRWQAEQAAMLRQREEQARCQEQQQTVVGAPNPGGNTVSIILTPVAKGGSATQLGLSCSTNLVQFLKTDYGTNQVSLYIRQEQDRLRTIGERIRKAVEARRFQVVEGKALFELNLRFSVVAQDGGGKMVGYVVVARTGQYLGSISSGHRYEVTVEGYLTKGGRTLLWHSKVSEHDVTEHATKKYDKTQKGRGNLTGQDWTIMTDPFDRLCSRLPSCATFR